MRSPFLFGYAKPVPVNFQALHNVRRHSILVAAAGPAMNFVLAILAALALHLLAYLPARPWIAENLKNALIINEVLLFLTCCPCCRSMVDDIGGLAPRRAFNSVATVVGTLWPDDFHRAHICFAVAWSAARHQIQT